MRTPESVEAPNETLQAELQTILDDELSCLPSRYRAPIVLCELEGLSRQDAATRLGVPEGTLSSRLARGKQRLRDRLTRRGLAVPAVLVSLVAIRETGATMPIDALIELTILAAMRVGAGPSAGAVISSSVVSLSDGVLKTMLLSKLKGIAVIIGSSAVMISVQLRSGNPQGRAGALPRSTTPSE